MKKTKLEDSFFIPIIRDGAIATGHAAEGRNIPIVILDFTRHPTVQHLIQLHQDVALGDALCTWGINKKFAFLILEFSRPAIVKFGIKFDLSTEAALADGIVQSRGLYIQPGKSGDTIVSNFDYPKILIEVPPKTKIPDWDDRILNAISKRMRHKGLSRKDAKSASKQFLKRMREIWGYRLKSS